MNRIALTLAVLFGLAACAPRGGSVPAGPGTAGANEPIASTSTEPAPPAE